MHEDENLKKIAEEVGQEILTGDEEVALDQPYPEELKRGGTHGQASETDPGKESESHDSATDKSGSSGKDDDEEEDEDDSGESGEDDDKDHGSSGRKRKMDKWVITAVAAGLVLCIIGVILLLSVGLVNGSIFLFFGAIVILAGVFSPFGY